MKKITLAITGASGIPFATKLLQELLNSNCKVNLVISQAGVLTSNQEMHFNLPTAPHKIHEILVDELQLANPNNLTVYAVKDWFAPIASGSSVDDVMIICPCSMATLAKVAGGIGDDLICRAADVILKERKNMLKLSDLGVSIIPPVPAFYTLPKTLDDVINFIVSRIMDQAGVNNDLTKRW